jgi:hypothetical protein
MASAQDRICEKFGGGRIITEFVCPVGYIDMGVIEAPSSNRQSSNAGMQIYQDMINRNEADRQARLNRQAAAAEAQRQREHEERMVRLRNSQQTSARRPTATPNSGQGLWEAWEIFLPNYSNRGATGFLTINTDCSAKIQGLGSDSEVSRILKTGSKLTLNNDAITMSAILTSPYAFSGTATLQGQGYEIKGTRTRRAGKASAFCFPPSSNSQLMSTDQEKREISEPESENITRGVSLVENLEALSKLHSDGILTEEEFNTAKRRLLGL